MPGSDVSGVVFFYVYVLESIPVKGHFYIGYTTDLRERVKEHNGGLNFSTKAYRPWRLIYYEACLHKEDAERREHYLKTNTGSRMLKLRLKQYLREKI